MVKKNFHKILLVILKLR